MREIVRFAAVAFIAMAALTHPAMAQESAPFTIDFSSTINTVLEYAAVAVMAGAMFLVKRGFTFLGIQNDAGKTAVIEQGLERAVNYAVGYVRDQLSTRSKVETHNALISTAATYAQAAIPGALKHFDISPEKLQQMIESRLYDDAVDMASGPAKLIEKDPNVMRVGEAAG